MKFLGNHPRRDFGAYSDDVDVLLRHVVETLTHYVATGEMAQRDKAGIAASH